MNNNTIKIVVFLLSVIFSLSLFTGVLLNIKDEKLLDIQIKVGQNFLLSKDTTLALNNAYRSIYVNYDILSKANNDLLLNTEILLSKYPKQLKIKDIRKLLLKRDKNIDLIKRANSIITNSLYFIKNLPPKVFSKTIYEKEIGANKLRKLSRKLIDLSYDIKLSDISILHKYQKLINEFKQIEVTHEKLKVYKEIFKTHTTQIVKNAQLMLDNITKFNLYEEELNNIYLTISNNISIEHLNIKQKVKYIQTILIASLFIFIYLIIRFLKLERINKEKEKELQDLISKNIIISTTNLKGIITSASEAFCKVSGYTQKELIGEPHNIIRHQDMQKNTFTTMWETIQAGNIWRGNIKNLKKDGSHYWVDAIIEPIFDEKGNIESYVAIRVDITNAIALEELTQNQENLIESQIHIANMQRDKALEASNAKSEFLANMSHEIRTPLNAIIGFIELLRENEKDTEKQRYLDIINNSSNNLVNIINDILDLSKIESGNLQIDNIDFNPNKEFQFTKKLFKAKIDEKNLNLFVSHIKFPNSLHGDILRIKQVINNLLSNAVKFTNNNKNIFLNIDYKDEKLYVSVKDEGIGISKKYQDKIFEAFSQEDSSTTRKYGGTGLGLSISYNLIQAMGGKLKLKSKLEVGSEFYFNIPMKLGKQITQEKHLDENIKLSGHILLVEDNIANQVFMKIILKKLNLTFDIANDGTEAISIFKNSINLKPYHAILMDENMPNMNGIEATRQILDYEKENNLQHTPIIALTANALKNDRAKFLNAGMDEYITKPVDKKLLMAILKHFLK